MLFFLLSLSAWAADPTFAGAEMPPAELPKESEASLSAELGGTVVSGNAMFYALNGAVRGEARWKRNKLSGSARVNIGASKPDLDGDGLLSEAERNAEYVRNVKRYDGELRYDRYFGERGSIYLLAGAIIDPFAGYDLRSHEQIGYSRLLVKQKNTQLRAEIGFDVAQENYVEDVDPNFDQIFAGRLLIGLQHKFSDEVSFSDTFELYENVEKIDDLRLLNTATLSSALSNRLSLKLSHSLIFDNIPVEGYQKLDQTTMLTLVATIL